jgi:hypothetical protein
MKSFYVLAIFIVLGTYINAQNNPFKKGDVWEGRYQCSGIQLNFNLTIEEVQDGVVISKFIFLNGQGEYEMIGKYDKNEFTFTGTNWIKNPNQAYVTLGLHGFYLKTPERLIGNTISKLSFTEGNECTGFYLERKK